MAKILLVEDDLVLSETLRFNLEREGYETLAAADGLLGLELARTRHPDLIILDLMLPSLDGFSICRILRQDDSVPIIMLSARQDEVDRIAGFELGADDYVVKPFSLGELLARIRVTLRRGVQTTAPGPRERLAHGDLQVEIGGRRAFHGERELALSQKEFDLLVCLMRNRGIALSRDLLLQRVWGYDYLGAARTVDVHIHWLREKIEANPAVPAYIHTVRGIGYRFEAPAG